MSVVRCCVITKCTFSGNTQGIKISGGGVVVEWWWSGGGVVVEWWWSGGGGVVVVINLPATCL